MGRIAEIEYTTNKTMAEKLTQLMFENPSLRVVAWINTDDIYDDYQFIAGSITDVSLEFIAYLDDGETYVAKDGDAFEDCLSYYGQDAEMWDDNTLNAKAEEIPWKQVIAVWVCAA